MRPDGGASRERILAAVHTDSGIHISELAVGTALSWHAIAHHLRVLQREGKVVVEKTGRNRHVFPAGVPASHRRWLAATRSERAMAVLRALLTGAAFDLSTLASRVPMGQKVLRRHLGDLDRAGLVERRGTWRPTYMVKRAEALEIASVLFGNDLTSGHRLGWWEWDPRRRRSKISREGWQILGVDPEPGRSFEAFAARFVHSDDLASLASVVGAALAEGRSYEHTVRIRTAAGERHIRQRGWVSARDVDGSVLRFSGTFEDVTDRVAPDGPETRSASKPLGSMPGRAIQQGQEPRTG